MSKLSDNDGPGLFYISTQPKSDKVEKEYHEWYNTEHGPLRLKLDFIRNGCRYRSRAIDPPVWLAIYDLNRISGLDEPRYTTLRENRSKRESDIIDHHLEFLDRRIYKNISSRGTYDKPAPVIMTVVFVVKNSLVDEIHRWYEEEHIDDLARIPGWRRSRRFELVEAEDQKAGFTELLAIHDFDSQNGIDGPEHQLAKSRPWRNKILELVESRDNNRFDFDHEFRAADYREPPQSHVSEANTFSYGPTDWNISGPENAPVIVFSNSLITDHHIWDLTIEGLKKEFREHRFLVYNTRGYAVDPKCKVDIDLLADDIAQLLDRCKVQKCMAVIGVSLGGVTTLNFAIRHPGRLEKFIACDCNLASTESNTRAWQERIRLGHQSWDQLADQTVQRWFSSKYKDTSSPRLNMIRDMITKADPQGFKSCVEALCNFDIRQAVQQIVVPGICVAGSEDGVLPTVLRSASEDIPGCKYIEIAGTGHLPMVEDPDQFVRLITPFLKYSE